MWGSGQFLSHFPHVGVFLCVATSIGGDMGGNGWGGHAPPTFWMGAFSLLPPPPVPAPLLTNELETCVNCSLLLPLFCSYCPHSHSLIALGSITKETPPPSIQFLPSSPESSFHPIPWMGGWGMPPQRFGWGLFPSCPPPTLRRHCLPMC